MKFNLEYAVLFGMTAFFGGLGILEGFYIDEVFFSQAAIIFMICIYMIIRDRRYQPESPL